MRLSYRAHYASCPSICPSVPYGLVTRKQKNRRKIKIGTDVPQGTSKWNANFQMNRSKIKVTGRQKPRKTGVMFTYGRQIRCRWIWRRLQTRPTPLLGHCRPEHETLGNWTDGRVSCRHLAATRFLDFVPFLYYVFFSLDPWILYIVNQHRDVLYNLYTVGQKRRYYILVLVLAKHHLIFKIYWHV